MSKEYLEAFKKIAEIYGNTGSLEGTYEYFLTIKRALVRLEAIENSNPSEALNVLKATEKYTGIDLTVIKQALLKAQEPKKYLKWEDLEFKGEEQTMKVILNGSVHFLSYYRNMFSDNLCMIDNTGITIWKENKQLFNDLHLERVEE